MTDDPAHTEPDPELPVTWESYLGYITQFMHARIAAGKMIRDTRKP